MLLAGLLYCHFNCPSVGLLFCKYSFFPTFLRQSKMYLIACSKELNPHSQTGSGRSNFWAERGSLGEEMRSVNWQGISYPPGICPEQHTRPLSFFNAQAGKLSKPTQGNPACWDASRRMKIQAEPGRHLEFHSGSEPCYATMHQCLRIIFNIPRWNIPCPHFKGVFQNWRQWIRKWWHILGTE